MPCRRGDLRSMIGRIFRIKHPYRNVLLDSGKNRGRMQNLGAKIGQLRRFLKADAFDPQRLWANAGIGRHNAIDVGPYFDSLRIQSAANQCSGIVGTSPA